MRHFKCNIRVYYFYNSFGQLVKTTTTGQSDTLYVYDALGNVIRQGHDINGNGSLGRTTSITDPRIGASVTHYNANGRIDYTQDPVGNTTTFAYDSMGRRISATDPLANTVRSSYTDHGQLEKTWGSGTYPVRYEYDSYGRMTKMRTYRGGAGWSGSEWPPSPGTADITEWIYHEASGLLIAKKDAVGKSVAYTYSAGGRLASRVWSRQDGTNALATTYAYNDTGDMVGIDYSDSTPDVAFTHDRLGRQLSASSSVSAHEFIYNAYLQLDTETIVRAGLTNIIERDYDSFGRASGFDLDSDYKVSYGYDTFGRMNSVSSMAQSAEYSYLPGSDLISGYTMGDLSVTRSFEPHRNLLTSIENKFDANTVSKYSYANDAGGRRISVIQTGTAFQPVGDMFNLYQYNTRSELTSAERYFGSSTNDTDNPVGLQDWLYAYDHIGNRTWTTKANATANYTANALNQYTERSVPGSSDIIGSAAQDVTITVNEEEADRQGYYWSHRLTVDNLFNPIYTQVVVEAICDPETNAPYIVSSETGNVFVAESPEYFTYDDDGNLLSDGRFNYSWDAENRLVAVETIEGLPEDMPIVHVEFAYDYMSRRVGKTVYQWDDGCTNWTQIDLRTFVYDDWLLVQEQSASGGNVTTNWYVHGLDLRGSLQGAGGIGGLLAAQLDTTPVIYTYDANGNVSELLSTNGTILAHYEYSPFGETIVATGDLADENKFRFSTKYFDDEIGLSYYGYRFYSSELGRWLSRDPLGELGGVHAYLFIGNDPLNQADYLGLLSIGDIISLIPGIGTIYNAIVDPKGSDVGDYTINISKKTCCELGDAAAELKCTQSIALQVASYELQYNGLFVGHALLDAVVGLLAKHPIAIGIVGVDAIVDMHITFKKIDKIGDAGTEAEKKCDCSLYK